MSDTCTRGVTGCDRAVYGGLVFVETCHSHPDMCCGRRQRECRCRVFVPLRLADRAMKYPVPLGNWRARIGTR